MSDQKNIKQKAPAVITRRRFLQMATSAPVAAMSAPPALALFANILEGQSRNAWAAEMGLEPRTFVNITAGGGPARWMYNNFLNPYGDPGFNNPHPMVASEFRPVGARYVGAQYVSYDMKGIKVPTFWTHMVPAPGGGYRPVADLLDNLLCIQGINTRNAGHDGAQLTAYLPTGAKQSSAALSADASNQPFAAINMGAAQFRFKSLKSKSSISVNAGAGISGLLSAFQPLNVARYNSDKAIFDAALSAVLPGLDSVAKKGHIGAQAIIENRDSAVKLAQTNFANLATVWTALLNKYTDLVSRSIYDLNNPLKGLTDMPIGDGSTSEAPFYELDVNSPQGYSTMSDFRNVIGPTSTVGGLAQSFALTEYILLNKLSSSISLNMPAISRLNTVMGNPTMGMTNDSHSSGKYPHTLVSTLRHRAGAACILELINQLKAANLFNDVVIREAGEFNRVPNSMQTGSDHGSRGLSQAFYCGAFNGPLIVGNLAKSNTANQWGSGGNIPELGRQLYPTDIIITLAHLLRVPPPLTSAKPVVTLTSSGLLSNIGTTKYV